MKYLINALEIFGVVYLRFRMVPRIWCVWLVGVNAACLYFITQIEGQVVLAVTALAVVLQTIIYERTQFSRVLGIVHLGWIPMFAWMATRLDTILADPALATWLAVLLATNAISLVVDLAEAWRFYKGDRAPHYSWKILPDVTGDLAYEGPTQ